MKCIENGYPVRCGNTSEYVPTTRVCDGKSHCPAGDDEQLSFCSTWNCTSNFKCNRDSKCILIRDVCDGYTHCSDGEDEMLSLCKEWPCGTGWTRREVNKCKDSYKCLKEHMICNGRQDCDDSSDEQDCHRLVTTHLVDFKMRGSCQPYKMVLIIIQF